MALTVPLFLQLTCNRCGFSETSLSQSAVLLLRWQRSRWQTVSSLSFQQSDAQWRSILWRRAWEGQANRKAEMRQNCDWLASWGGGVSTPNRICIPMRSRERKGLCCHSNTPAVAEYRCASLIWGLCVFYAEGEVSECWSNILFFVFLSIFHFSSELLIIYFVANFMYIAIVTERTHKVLHKVKIQP